MTRPSTPHGWCLLALAVFYLVLASLSFDDLRGNDAGYHPFGHVMRVLTSLGAFGAILLRRRAAIELAGWVALLSATAACPYQLHPPPDGAVDVAYTLQLLGALAGLAYLIGSRRALFAPRAGPASPMRQLAGSLRFTFALLLVAESWADHTIRLTETSLLHLVSGRPTEFEYANEHSRYSTMRAPIAGLPHAVVLGSSPIMIEREARQPAAARLADHFHGRMNILWSDTGGIPTSVLRRAAEQFERGEREPRPEALILYAGIQDYHAAASWSYLHDMKQELSPQRDAGPLLWLIRNSRLVALSLQRRFYCRTRADETCATHDAELALARVRENFEEIALSAGRMGARVIACTVILFPERTPEEATRHILSVNARVRDLAARHDHVTLVDMAKIARQTYPDGPAPDCSPLEGGLSPDTCGNEFHLNPEGHQLVADHLSPTLEAWLKEWRP
jgi:hypothetical protein